MANERNNNQDDLLDRTPRAQDTRVGEQRATDSYRPASVLPVPEDRDGWRFRWIRAASLGNADNANVSRRFRESWVPVEVKDHPELMVMSDIGSQFKGNIEIGGLLLCKAPAEQVEARKKYYKDMAANQMTSVDNSFLRENDPRMPLLQPERSTTRSRFGKG